MQRRKRDEVDLKREKVHTFLMKVGIEEENIKDAKLFHWCQTKFYLNLSIVEGIFNFHAVILEF